MSVLDNVLTLTNVSDLIHLTNRHLLNGVVTQCHRKMKRCLIDSLLLLLLTEVGKMPANSSDIREHCG